MKLPSFLPDPIRLGLTFALLTLLALGLRATGLDFGFPYQWHPDEPAIINYSIRMIQTGDMNPHRFNYPTSYMYVQTIGAVLSWFSYVGSNPWQDIDAVPTGFDTKFMWFIGHESIWERGRFLTSMLGALAVGVTYLAGRKLFGERAGILSALLFAFSPLHIELSRYIAVDVPTSLACATLLLASAYILKEGEFHHYVLAAICMGWVIASKYNAALCGVAPLLAWLLSEKRDQQFWFGVSFLPLSMLFFVMFMPYFLLDFSTAVRDMAREVNHYKYAEDIIEPGLPHIWAMVKMFASDIAPGVLLLLPVGLYGGVKQKRYEMVVVSILPIAYLGYMSSSVVFYQRNLCPAMPSLFLLLGLGMDWLWGHRLARVAAVGLMLVPGVKSGLEIRDHLAQVDTRVQVADYVKTQPGVVLGVPKELRFIFDLRTLGAIEVREVSLVEQSPEEWAEAGITHILGARSMRVVGETALNITTADLNAAEAWFNTEKPEFYRGQLVLTLDRANRQPGVGVWRVGATKKARPMPKWRIPASVPPELVQTTETGVGVQGGEKPVAVCETQGVRMLDSMLVSGRYKVENGPPAKQRGPRVLVRFFDASNKALGGAAGGIQLLAEGHGNTDWTEFSESIRLPAGAMMARVCVESALPDAVLWVDGVVWAGSR